MKYNGPEIRQPGMYDVIAACEECCVQDFGPSLTQQSQAEEADINTIVRRFGIGNIPLPPNHRPPIYGDFSEIGDYRTALHAVHAAEDAFLKYPAALRARFNNDPQELMDFLDDKNNLAEARKLGLATPEAPPASTAGAGGTPPAPTPPAPPGAGDPGVAKPS